MSEVKIKLLTDQGEEDVSLNISFDSMSLQELTTLEETVGPDVFDQLSSGKVSPRPSVLRAMVFAKLKTVYPTLEIEQFDTDSAALVEALTEADGPKDSETG